MAKQLKYNHPKLIIDALADMPIQTEVIVSTYINLLVDHIMEARDMAELMLEQRNKVMTLVDEAIAKISEDIAPSASKDKAAQVTAELLAKMGAA